MIVVRHNLEVLDRSKPPWLETGDGGCQSPPSASCPAREAIDVPVREQLIVELYSK